MDEYYSCEFCHFDFKSFKERSKCPGCGVEINELPLFIAVKREAKKFSVQDMLDKLGWKRPNYNDMTYLDIESDIEEVTYVLDFREVKILFEVLDIDWNEALGFIIGKENVSLSATSDDRPTYKIINSQMTKLGFSNEKLAVELDFDADEIANVQVPNSSFDKWALKNMLNLAKILQINPVAFIHKVIEG